MRPLSLRRWISRGYVPKTQVMFSLGDQNASKYCLDLLPCAGLSVNLRLLEHIFIIGGEVHRDS